MTTMFNKLPHLSCLSKSGTEYTIVLNTLLD
jgi:hypothetical protein